MNGSVERIRTLLNHSYLSEIDVLHDHWYKSMTTCSQSSCVDKVIRYVTFADCCKPWGFIQSLAQWLVKQRDLSERRFIYFFEVGGHVYYDNADVIACLAAYVTYCLVNYILRTPVDFCYLLYNASLLLMPTRCFATCVFSNVEGKFLHEFGSIFWWTGIFVTFESTFCGDFHIFGIYHISYSVWQLPGVSSVTNSSDF